MRSFPGFFEQIFFTESTTGQPIICDGTMRVSVRGLFVLRGHPLLQEGDGPYQGWLVFDGVNSSKRTVTEYDQENGTDSRPRFKAMYEVVDGPFPTPTCGELQDFGFETMQEKPEAWVDDWVIQANSFTLIVM